MLNAKELLHRLATGSPGPHLITPNVGPHQELADFVSNHPEICDLYFFQTSGSEGRAKWVGLSREAIFTSARYVNHHLESTARDRWLLCLPLHHVGGFSILARAHLNSASFIHDAEKWNPQRFAQLCETHQITLSSLVPTQVFDLVQRRLTAPASLRAIVVGGGGLAAELGQQAQELGWPVLQSYGMTETASQVATASLSQLHQGFDPDSMEVLPHWQLRTEPETGRLLIRGSSLASGYVIQDDASSWRWQPIGDELQTRDFVKLWQHGTRWFLQMMGRESSFLKIKGELVHLQDLQKLIDQLLPGSAICPLPDPRRETRLVLVWTDTQYLPDRVKAAWDEYHRRTRPFERLHHHLPLPQIPRTDLGKLNMPALKELLSKMPELQTPD